MNLKYNMAPKEQWRIHFLSLSTNIIITTGNGFRINCLMLFPTSILRSDLISYK